MNGRHLAGPRLFASCCEPSMPGVAHEVHTLAQLFTKDDVGEDCTLLQHGMTVVDTLNERLLMSVIWYKGVTRVLSSEALSTFSRICSALGSFLVSSW